MTRAEALWAQVESSKPSDVEGMTQELVAAFGAWRKGLAQPLGAVAFYFAGAEVEPYVPSDAWSHGFASATLQDGRLRGERLFREGRGFTPRPLRALHDALLEAAEAGPTADEAALDALKQPVVALTLARLTEALRRATADAAFSALTGVRPFRFFATPGHDEPTVPVLELE